MSYVKSLEQCLPFLKCCWRVGHIEPGWRDAHQLPDGLFKSSSSPFLTSFQHLREFSHLSYASVLLFCRRRRMQHAVYQVPTDAPWDILQAWEPCRSTSCHECCYHTPHSPGLFGEVGSLDLCRHFMTRLWSLSGHLMVLDEACLSPLWPPGPFWVCCRKGMHHFSYFSYLPSQLLQQALDMTVVCFGLAFRPSAGFAAEGGGAETI